MTYEKIFVVVVGVVFISSFIFGGLVVSAEVENVDDSGFLLWEENVDGRVRKVHYHDEQVYYAQRVWNLTVSSRGFRDGELDWDYEVQMEDIDTDNPNWRVEEIHDMKVADDYLWVVYSVFYGEEYQYHVLQRQNLENGTIEEHLKLVEGINNETVIQTGYITDNYFVYTTNYSDSYGEGFSDIRRVPIGEGDVDIIHEFPFEAIIQTIIVDDDNVFVGFDDGEGAVKYSLEDEEIVWERGLVGSVEYREGMVIHDEFIYVSNKDAVVFSLYKSNGTVNWMEKDSVYDSGVLTVDGNRVYLGQTDGQILGLCVEDGDKEFAYQTNHTHINSLDSYDGFLFSGCEDYNVMSFDTLGERRLARDMKDIFAILLIIIFVGTIAYGVLSWIKPVV